MMRPNTKSKVSWIYSTIKCFCKRHRQYTVRAIRHNIFFEDTNGLKESGAIVRNGGGYWSMKKDSLHGLKRVVWKEMHDDGLQSKRRCNPLW